MPRFSRLFALFLLAGPIAAETTSSMTTPNPLPVDSDAPFSEGEAEEKGIIPPRAELRPSTQTVTPVTDFPSRPIYDQAKEEIARAESLFKSGDYEAASDTALEAYDDLMEIRRRRKSERRKLRADRRHAAGVYIKASIAYIESYADKRNRTAEALQEAHDRLTDLRDVSVNYDELNRLVNTAMENAARR